MSVGAVIACLVFVVTIPMTKIFAERKLMLWGGFLITMMASLFLMPWGPDSPKMAIPQNLTLGDLRELAATAQYANFTLDEIIANLTMPGEIVLGCPIVQTWCEYTPALTVMQLCIAYVCASIGYPLGVTLIQTIFSKILGPRPQVIIIYQLFYLKHRALSLLYLLIFFLTAKLILHYSIKCFFISFQD